MLGEELRRLRGERSQKTIADAAGITQAFLSELERGEKSRMGADVLFRLCRALGVACQHFEPFLAPAEEAESAPPAAGPPKPKRGRPKKNNAE